MAVLARWILALSWAVFVAIFVRNWFRVQAHRRRHGETWEGRREDKPSRLGLYLQGGIILASIPGGGARPEWLMALAALLAAASTAFVFIALHHLGAQWRVNTVVTRDHILVTTGPYALVRHPVYTAILGITVATVLLFSSPLFGIAALVIYSAGTEIRVRAEDALLESHFGSAHRQWRAQTKAWIPLLR